jgi:membrane peptidoglycan carboxypeptidase
LAALIREPETADPARDPQLARANQTETLKAVLRDKKISPAQATAVEALPFPRYVLPPAAQVSKAQSAALGDDYFIAAVRQQLYAKYGPRLVDRGGLRVTTTFNPTLQAEAYRAVYGHQAGSLNPAAGEPGYIATC